MSKHARHRASRSRINWRGMKRTLQNRWWFFWKPQLKRNLHAFFSRSAR